jgi:hypothetical protein
MSLESLKLKTFRVCYLRTCNILAKINDFVFRNVLLSCLVSDLHKPSLPGIEQFFVVTFLFVLFL